jgi:two-component system, LytTR family, sensor histidine kinase AlgZ
VCADVYLTALETRLEPHDTSSSVATSLSAWSSETKGNIRYVVSRASSSVAMYRRSCHCARVRYSQGPSAYFGMRHYESEPEPSIIRATLAALVQPRRMVAILLVSTALVVAQGKSSADPMAVPLGVVMCLLFVIVAPVSWRVLFPQRIDLRHGGIRLLLYGAIGAGVVLTVGVVVPRLFGVGRTLLTAPSSVTICLALFFVGGWGLARDIWLESSLERSEARASALAREAERAQLLAIRSHLDPHFLFNTLNAIAEWCRDDGEVAERAVLQLSAMLRAVLEGVQAPTWSLREELALVDTLFALHALRDPDRVRLVRRLPDPLPDAAIPPMLLLALAENAIKHGVAAGHGGDVVLEVEATRTGGTLVVRLDNDGVFAGRRAGGMGLEMVERWLALAYEGRATFQIRANGTRTVAEVAFPVGLAHREARV